MFPGTLFKRCTLLLPTKDRLKFVLGQFSEVRKSEQVRQFRGKRHVSFLHFYHYEAETPTAVWLADRFRASQWTSASHRAALASPATAASSRWERCFTAGQMKANFFGCKWNPVWARLIRNASSKPFQNLISGWDKLECHRVFNYLCETTNLPKKVQQVTAGQPGAFQSNWTKLGRSECWKWRLCFSMLLSFLLFSIYAFSWLAGLVHRSEAARGASGSTILPECSGWPVAGPAGPTALADHDPEALANSEPGAAPLYPLWTHAHRWWDSDLGTLVQFTHSNCLVTRQFTRRTRV